MSVSTKDRPAAVTSAPKEPIIRDPEFGRRITKAADDHPHCPPLHGGRIRWFQDELKKRFGVVVSPESVRKWLVGEMKPRPAKIAQLAQILSVDIAWLTLGLDANLQPRDLKLRNAMVSGVVNIITGLIQMEGGFPAFPEEGDKRAEREKIDLYAIIKGANYSIHVALGEPVGEGVVFPTPTEHENLVVLGVVKNGFSFRVFELSSDVIEAFGKRRGGSIEVTIGNVDEDLREITTFGNRL